MRSYILSNKVKGTRDSRIYPDIWKELPIKIASAKDQAEIATRVDKVQELYQQLNSLQPLSALLTHPSIQYKPVSGYLAQGILRFVGDVDNRIGSKPLLREDKLILCRRPQMYLESSSQMLLQYLELYLTKLDATFYDKTWAEARKRIRVPADLNFLNEFMMLLAQRNQKELDIRTNIQDVLQEIENLLEEIYQNIPDPQNKAVIDSKRAVKVDTGHLL
jgi:hypothetical protein